MPPNGVSLARSTSTWIHWWSPVTSANVSTSFCVTSCQSEVPSVSPCAALSSSSPVIVRMASTILRAVPAPLLLCDTPGLLYRGFFALPDSIKGAREPPINALVGSLNMTLWCIEKYQPRAVVMCFGQESADYRVEAYPDYHAARPEMPDDLAWQWERAPSLYEAMGWTVLGHDSLEADDLMGSFAALETEHGGETLILTADRDMFQCANDQRDDPAAEGAPAGAGRGRARTRCARSTASARSRSRTSSPCAATRPTGCRARRASVPRPRRISCTARATSST